MTIEPTASFWDCGEFISTSYKLLVGHPPGAPFFMIMGRFFSLFAPDQGAVAAMINIMSALASAFTILFLFWTITHLAKKIFISEEEPPIWRTMAVMGAGLVGALAYTFSDTFWFSAVEGEVYAMSSLFTAVVFWAILKWENVAGKPYANRWLVLIAYLMGLSIGVHLLNLLAIPAIVFVYYFKLYEVNRNNTIKALVISGVILAGVLYGIIPGVVTVASWFELIFVNGLGLPFNTGALFYAVLLIAALVAGIWITYKKRMAIANTILLGVTVILIGYSSFAMIVIRSYANPPMDQNSPEDVFSLMSYLNREQYGDRPLFFGQNFNSPLDRKSMNEEDGAPVRIKKDGKYVTVMHRTEYAFDDKTTTIFPRMYSREAHHIEQYKAWTDFKGKRVTVGDERGVPKQIQVPTLWENIKFFMNYQVNYMYFRYFMWNFSGRQNDIQGHGEVNKGNWITGIKFIDQMRLGDESKLSDLYTKNRGRNKYYMLPLILGLVGMFFQFNAGKNGKQSFWIVLLLFFLTGLAIVIYLNQTPYQPRERDYAYAGSFYAFAIWIGLGVLAIVDGLKRFVPGSVGAGIATILSLIFVPGIMATENWDDHDRSERYVARDLAYNYLNTCADNAIIFTNGDNDTFPLWYAQEVEGVRTDVRVCNLSYLQTDWYIDQMKRKAYDSDPMPFSMNHDQYVTGSRDVVYMLDRIKGAIDLKDAIDFVASDNKKTKTVPEYSGTLDYLPSKQFTLKYDSLKVLQNGIVSEEAAHLLAPQVDINIKKDVILKNELMILDLFATNNWDRPVYFAVTVGADNYVSLQDYFQLEGFAYQVVPIKTESDNGQYGRVDTERMYTNMMEKFRWGGFENPKVYLDENHMRMANNIRNNLARLALALLDEGKNEKAQKVLDKTMEVLSEDRVPHNYFSIFLAEGYFRLGEFEKGEEILKDLSTDKMKDFDYYSSLTPDKQKTVGREPDTAMAIYMEVVRMAQKYNRTDFMKQLQGDYEQRMNQMGFYEN
ncbi:protein O-mannosyl-transferase family [Carboxylicivirga caseinilyticus]|uniref:protein O-mannosyl-transferase family n=1 Tax=Carboxylicivirga caseinilyticus TaxID=3417572 RepID=UPI003D354454